MKYVLLFTAFLIGCAPEVVRQPETPVVGPPGLAGIDGQSCTVAQTATGATITCANGSTATITNGSAGSVGATGAAGQNAQPCTVTPFNNGSLISCPNGTNQVITNGSNGSAGAQGLGAGISVVQDTHTCTNGGIDVTTFLDPFNTGIFQAGDVVTSNSVVCNGVGIVGATGAAGSSGAAGVDGNSTSITQTPATLAQCPAGGVVIQTSTTQPDGTVINTASNTVCSGQTGAAGQVGLSGPAGVSGSAGQNGTSVVFSIVAASVAQCSNGGNVIMMGLDTNNDGILDAGDSDIQSAIVCTGNVGAVGPAGPQGVSGLVPEFTPVAVVNPCGPNSATYKESLLGLEGGDILSEFTGGSSTSDVANILLPDGSSYADTDASACIFSVSTDGQGDRSVTWSGAASNGTWSPGNAYYNATTQQWTVTYGPIGD